MISFLFAHNCRDLSPDYEPLSPAMSSPGPSISERGGKHSPARSLVSEPGQSIAPVLVRAAAPPTAMQTAVAPALKPLTVLQPPVSQPKPQQQQQLNVTTMQPAKRAVQFVQRQLPPKTQQFLPSSNVVQATFQPVIPSVPSNTSTANGAGKPKTLVFTCPPASQTTNNNNNNHKPQYVIEKTVGGSVIVSESPNGQKRSVGHITMQPQQQQPQQLQQPVKKEVKIYKMSPSGVLTHTTQTAPVLSTGQPPSKKVNIQMKDGAIRTMAATPQASSPSAAAYVINKTGNAAGTAQFAGVRRLVRVQQQQPGNTSTVLATNGGAPGTSRSILLPVSFQDVKDFRTIKIINASNMNNKSANIKLAAANMLQQSKQGLVQKNVLFSKEQLIGKTI